MMKYCKRYNHPEANTAHLPPQTHLLGYWGFVGDVLGEGRVLGERGEGSIMMALRMKSTNYKNNQKICNYKMLCNRRILASTHDQIANVVYIVC